MHNNFLRPLFLSLILVLARPALSFCQNVGVGTTTPSFKLDVRNGSINTDSVYRINSFPVLSTMGTGNLFTGRQAGQLNTGNYNTFSGHLAGSANTTGEHNCFFGSMAGISNTLGKGNSFFGYQSGYSNTTGQWNSFFGDGTGTFNLDGNENLFVGQQSGYFNTSGSQNAFLGFKAGIANTTGNNNSFIGWESGFNNTTGKNNSFYGYQAGFFNITGGSNVFVGKQAGYNGGGSQNCFIGDSAGFSNQTGNYNTYVGYRTGRTNSDGASNAAFGIDAGQINTGSYNSFFGSESGFANSSGSLNCFVGNLAGENNTTGSHNTAFGGIAGPSSGNLSYTTAVGYGAVAACNNCMALGGVVANGEQTRVGINNAVPLTDLHIVQQTDAALDKVRGIRLQRFVNSNHWRTLIDPSNNYVFEYNDALYSYIEPSGGAFVNPSDQRLKRDISPLDNVLDKTMQLRAKTYYYNTSETKDRRSYGFLAQDVEKLFPEFVFTGATGYKGIAYSNFSVIAIKAVQEQQMLIEKLENKIEQLEERILRLEKK